MEEKKKAMDMQKHLKLIWGRISEASTLFMTSKGSRNLKQTTKQVEGYKDTRISQVFNLEEVLFCLKRGWISAKQFQF